MIITIGNVLGGLGLLLIGMSLMTDGLKLAAGNALRDILALWTNSRQRGLFSGILITGIVQSSSAVTVATIGFANAGVLSLERAIWVIFGSNVGTTMTAWIVALVGFKINIEAVALPLLGLGALLKLTGAQTGRASLGLALVGFAMLFLGIGVLKSSFELLSGDFRLPDAGSLTILTVLVYTGAGFLLTTLMQSSSAAMVVALSAADSGLIPYDAAAALVIGANLGTTTTAIISVFGATATAKRVALSHVIFNVLTAIVAIALLAPMLWLSDQFQEVFSENPSPAVGLALFHTVFNVLGVLLMWPLSRRMVQYLNTLFLTAEETESKPKYLDKNVLALPYMAVDALTLEVSRVANLSIQLLQKSLHSPRARAAKQEEVLIVRNLAHEIGSYAALLNRTTLTPFLAEAVQGLIEVTQQFLMTVDIGEDIATLNQVPFTHMEKHFQEQFDLFSQAADLHLDTMTPDNTAECINSTATYNNIETSYDALKEAILRNAAFGELKISDMDLMLQYVNQVKRGCRHLWKASRKLVTIRESFQRNPEGNVIASSVSDKGNIELLQESDKDIAAESSQETDR